MSTYDPEPLDRQEESVLRVLEENNGMRIETAASELDMGYSEVKKTLQSLTNKSLVVVSPGFEYEADRDR